MKLNSALPLGNAATGTPYYAGPPPYYSSAMILDRPLGKINGGTITPLTNDLYDGEIQINLNTPVNTNWPAATPPGQTDLYSIVLHEALHILGFASRIGLGVEHSVWDHNLHAVDEFPPSSAAIPVFFNSFVQLGLGPCERNAWTINPDAYYPDYNCLNDDPDMVFGDNAIAPLFGGQGTTLSGNDLANALSHLNEECGGTAYVMSPIFDPGDDSKRTITGAELDILCKLGYKLNNGCEGCYVVAHEETPPSFFNEGCCHPTLTFCNNQPDKFILISDLICNDFSSQSNKTISHVVFIGMGTAGLTATIQGGKIKLPDNMPADGYLLQYTLKSDDCNCLMHEARINIEIIECPPCSPPTDICESQICVSDFEDYNPLGGWGFYPLFGTTLPRTCFEGYAQYGTPDIFVNESTGNQMLNIGQASPTFGIESGRESVTYELETCIPPGCSLTLDMLAGTRVGGELTSEILHVWGSSNLPCEEIKLKNTAGVPNICSSTYTFTPIELGTIQPNPVPISDFPFYELDPITQFIWPNQTNVDVCYLTLVCGQTATRGSILIDDISAKRTCAPTLTCNYAGPMEVCNNETSTLTWEICADDLPGNTNTTVTATITLPAGVTAVDPAQLNQTITLTEGNCATVSVIVESTLPTGAMVDATLDATATGTCSTATLNCSANLTVTTCAGPSLVCPCTTANTLNINASSTSPLFDPALNGVLYSTLEAANNYDQNNDGIISATEHNNCMHIEGNLIIDQPLTIENCTNVKMDQDAAITVKSNAKLWFKSTTLYGCQYRWQGVTAETNAELFATNSQFYDANHALRYMGRNNMMVKNSQFINNLYGIEIPEANSTRSVFNFGIENNKFIGNATLKPTFDPNNTAGNWAFVGIHMSDVTGMGIDTNNKFIGLSAGVISDESTCTIRKSEFSDLIANTSQSIQLCGIYTTNLSNTRVEDCTFNGVGIGIEAHNSNIEVSRNTIVTNVVPTLGIVNSGIYYVDGNNRQIRIKNNAITTRYEGISIYNCLSPAFLEVSTDSIYLHSGQNEGGFGISFNGCNDGRILNNRLFNTNNLTAPFIAIQLDNSAWNTVQGNRTEQCSRGIQIISGAYNQIAANEFVGLTDPSLLSIGAVTINSNNNTYCDNITDGHNNSGFLFSAPCNGTEFTCNDMQSAYQGLYLDNTARISPQLNKGNTWTGPFDYKGAVHASTNPFLIQDSRFSTDQMVDWIAGGGQSIPWFSPLGGGEQPLNCATAQCPLFEGKLGKPRGDEAGIINDITEEGFRWIAQSRLLEHLAAADNLNGTFPADVVNFYNAAPNTDLGKNANLTHQMDLFHQRTASENNSLQVATGAIGVALQDLDNTRTFYANTPPDQWASVLSDKTSQLETSNTAFFNAASGIASARTTEASALLAQNNVWTPGSTPADNERELNAVYLNQALWNTHSIAATDLEKIKSIADQCPADGGSAVYRARNIYKRLVPTAYWDINMACAGERNDQQVANLTTHDISVFPNPANDAIHFALTRPIDYDVDFAIYDTHGALMHSQVVLANTSLTTVAVNTIPSGVYFYRFTSEKGQPVQGKFIVKH